MGLKSAGLICAMTWWLVPLATAAPGVRGKKRHGMPVRPVATTGPAFIPAPQGFDTVKAALSQFDYALAMHDAGMLRAAGVDGDSAKRWARFFRENPRATVTDDCPISELLTSENSATWTCIETVTIISAGRPRAFYHAIHFTFGRKSGAWKVAGRQ